MKSAAAPTGDNAPYAWHRGFTRYISEPTRARKEPSGTREERLMWTPPTASDASTRPQRERAGSDRLGPHCRQSCHRSRRPSHRLLRSCQPLIRVARIGNSDASFCCLPSRVQMSSNPEDGGLPRDSSADSSPIPPPIPPRLSITLLNPNTSS